MSASETGPARTTGATGATRATGTPGDNWAARTVVVVLATFVLVHASVVLGLVAGLPFFSEDWTHLDVAASIGSLAEALDPAREPLRPLQHALFHVLSRFDDPSPALARWPGLALHAGACGLVFALARGLGAGRLGAALAALLFYAFPSVKAWTWIAAVSGPARVFFVLAGLVAFVAHRRRPTLVTGLVLLASGVLALCAHESAIVLPVLCALWVVTGATSLAAFKPKLASLLRDPWFLATATATFAWVAWLALRPQRHHGVRGLESLPANVAKASLALFPEALREPCVALLRGTSGTVGMIAACVALLALYAGLVVLFRRGSHVTRFVILAVLVDLLLPVLAAGFVQRYAVLSAALVACALACGYARKPTAARLSALALLFFLWCADALEDAREYARAGATQAAVLAVAANERAEAGPNATIVFVGLPDMAGDEADLPLFNWGLPQMFRRAGLEGPWLFWRTRPFATSTDVRLVTSADVAAARASGMRVVSHGVEGIAPDPLPPR